MKKIFEEAELGQIRIPNRIVRSATWENLATEEGHLTESLKEVYRKIAAGRVGLIITGYANIVKEEKPNPGMMGIYDDTFVSEYKELTDMVHADGSKIVLQVAYGGTKTTYQVGERVIYAPSEVPEVTTNVQGKPMTLEEIEYIEEAFAQAARRSKESGFDAVEIHAAHTYLINQFLSPYYNRRDDEYGGSLENRMRFLVEIYHKMREQVGAEYPILVKLTATDFLDGGLSFEETRLICKELERLGVDAIELSGNIHGKAKTMVGQEFDGYPISEEGFFVEFAKVIGEDVKIPVMTVGGFKDIAKMEEILNNSEIEFFGICRPLLAEPELVGRWESGDRKKALCIHCSKCRTDTGNYCVVFQ